MALEYVTIKMSINPFSIFSNKKSQILAYAEDISVIRRSMTTVKEIYTEVENTAKVVSLRIKSEKKKQGC